MNYIILNYNNSVINDVLLRARNHLVSKYESLKYVVISKKGIFEIRKYESYQTVAVNESELSGRSGFGILFSYISGNNEKKEKIAMTIPVINAFETKKMSMEFVVPSKYRNENTPKPNDRDISIKTYEEHYAGVIVFSGRATEEHIEKYTRLLKDFLEAQNIKHQNIVRLARYNSPFQLPVFRRNEIVIEIEHENV